MPFCTAYRGCHWRCRNCEHFPANFLETATPELKAKWEEYKKAPDPFYNDVCLLDVQAVADELRAIDASCERRDQLVADSLALYHQRQNSEHI